MATRFVLSRRVREITYENFSYSNTTAVHLFTVPRGARFLAWIINVTVGFAGGGGGTGTLDIGTASNTDAYVDAAIVSAIGNIDLATTLVAPLAQVTVPTDIYGIAMGSDTAGTCDITLLFSYDKDTPL